MEKRDYADAILSSNAPAVAVQIWKDRLNNAKLLHTELADWMKELAAAEDAYAKSLARLSKMGNLKEFDSLGTFNSTWDYVLQSTSTRAQAHSTLAQQVQSQAEEPLRSYGSKTSDVTHMRNMEANLSSSARDIEVAEKQVEKYRKKGNKVQATKVAGAVQKVNDKLAVWNAEAPLVFEGLQVIDEARMTELKGTFVKFFTMLVDEQQKNLEINQRAMSNVLEISVEAATVQYAESQKGSQTLDKPPTRSLTSRTTQSISSATTEESSNLQQQASPAVSASGGSLRSKVGSLMGRNKDRTRLSMFGRPSSPEKQGSPSLGHRPTSSYGGEYLPNMPRSESHFLGLAVDAAARPTQTQWNDGQKAASSPSRETNGVKGPANGASLLDSNPERPRDAEGYSQPPASHPDDIEIEQIQEEPSRAYRVDIKDSVIREEDEAAKNAMSQVTTTLRAQPTTSRRNRGRRDVKSTILDEASSPTSQMAPSLASFAPLNRQNSLASDTQSLRSTASGTSMFAAAIKHPVLSGPGFSASHIQAINVSCSVNKTIEKLVFLGEIAFACHNDAAGEETVRVANVESTEKLATNPAFVSALAGRPDEYRIQTGNLSTTQVGFKYKLRVNESETALLPVEVTPMWKIEENQASLIVSLKAVSGQATTISDVSMAISLAGGSAQNCQSKPAGAFSRERQRLIWKMDSIELDGDQRYLARFVTKGAVHQFGPIQLAYTIADVAFTASPSLVLTGSDDPFVDGANSTVGDIKTVSSRSFLHLQS